ncbi:MAG: hypothetical protein M3Y91_08190, partial [Actinomycetota bacterium]|nr:hypothetical protein [Actinomycetota bacterium]
MTDADAAMTLRAEDLAVTGVDPATETILTAEETDAIGDAFARWLGVGGRGIIVFPFTSLQPLPRPRRPTADGRRRLPPGITPEGARHPAWWLDAHTTWQDPDESDLAYGVRLALELEHRGVSIPGDGPIDALASGLGWAAADPVTDARLAAYAAGAWDADLCRFELGPGPDGDRRPGGRAELQRQARQLLAPRLELLETLRARRSALHHATLSAERTLVERLEADLDGLVDGVRVHGEKLAWQARHGDDRGRLLTARQSLASSMEALLAALEDLDDARWRHGAPHDPTARGAVGREAGRPGKRHREAAALIGAVYATPAEEAPYLALHRGLEAWRPAATRTADA